MKKLNTKTYDAIQLLFSTLSESEQVMLMTELYYSMRDGQKDKFLEETENG